MRIGKLQINWNPPRPKIDRQLSLEKFYTFKTGEVIYTYKVEDLARISGRYLDEVKNTLNFMLKYAAGPKQVKAFADNVSAKLLLAIEDPNPQKRLDHIIEAREIAKRLPKLQDYVEDIHLKHWHDLYVMFFVLDGEDECYFSKKWNDKKIELLKAEGDEAAEVFFFVSRGSYDTLFRYLQKRYDKLYGEGEGSHGNGGLFDNANKQAEYEIHVSKWAGIGIEEYRDMSIDVRHELCLSYYNEAKRAEKENAK